MQATPPKLELRMGAGLSTAADSTRAAENACDQCLDALGGGSVDTAFLHFSTHHTEHAPDIASVVLRRLGVKNLVGVSTVAAIGGVSELEGTPGLSILAGAMPGVTAKTFTFEELPALPDDDAAAREETLGAIGEVIGVAPDLRMTLLLVDPFSVPLVRMLPAMNKSRAGSKAPIFGGMGSASNSPGGNVLVLNDRVFRSGGVGISLRGSLHVDTVLSQGCRPFGPNMVVTKAKGNMIFELGGRSALDVAQETVLELGESYTEKLAGGLFIGRVIDEYKDRFGRNDFLIRNVVGVDQNRGALAVADRVRVGQTIRLHCRDAVTAHEDLALLLDAQKLYDKPKGIMLITCNGRGRRMFGASETPNDHDALAVARAFSQSQGGEFLSKPGKPFEPQLEVPVPVAGFFANGEIGPVGDESFVHGHTACLALFRDR